MAVDVLQKIQALLALAASSNLDEARNASYVAVKLIRQHHIVLVHPATQTGTSFPPPSVPMGKAVPAKKRKAPTPDDGWKSIKAKFGGSCKWCGKRIEQNAPIYWSKDHGAYHPVCYANSK